MAEDSLRYELGFWNALTIGIDAFLQQKSFDLTIIGASRGWSFRQVLFGATPNAVADQVDHSVLLVRRYVPDTLAVKATEGFKRLKESVGFTTSPDTEAVRDV